MGRKRGLIDTDNLLRMALCVAVGAVFFVCAAVDWKTYLDSASWERVSARIEELDFYEYRGDYKVECRYSYELAGREYESTRVDIWDRSSREYGRHRRRYELLKRHMDSERPLPALADPEDPERAVLFRERHVLMYAFVVFGLFFAVGGPVGIWLLSRSLSGLEASPDETKTAPAERPWKLRDDWRELRVRASGRKGVAFAWAAGLGLSAAFSILTIAAGGAAPFVGWLAWACGAAGAAFLLKAVFLTVRRVVYGTPELALTKVPIVPGRQFVAAVRTGRPLDEARTELVLSCVERGEGRKAPVRELYKERLSADAGSVRPGGDPTSLHLAVDIPEDLPGRRDDEAPFVTWTLELRAPAFPVALKASFDLPVFKVGRPDIEKGKA